jgi:hypothetical protein
MLQVGPLLVQRGELSFGHGPLLRPLLPNTVQGTERKEAFNARSPIELNAR